MVIPTNQEIDKLRAVWSASTVGFRFTSNQTIERFLLSSKGTIPLCAGLRDSGWNMLFDKSLLGKSDPQVFAPLATALKATLGKCRLGQLRDSYNDPNWFSAELRKTSPFALAVIGNSSGPTPDREMTDAHKDWNKLEQIPYIQKMIGLTLVNVSKPDVFRFYRNFKEKEVAGK